MGSTETGEVQKVDPIVWGNQRLYGEWMQYLLESEQLTVFPVAPVPALKIGKALLTQDEYEGAEQAATINEGKGLKRAFAVAQNREPVETNGNSTDQPGDSLQDLAASIATLGLPEQEALTRQFVVGHGKFPDLHRIIRRRDHHYSPVDKVNEGRRKGEEENGDLQPYKRESLYRDLDSELAAAGQAIIGGKVLENRL